METPEIWLLRLLIAHLLTDFVLQPAPWIRARNERHFRSWQLYVHGAITGLVAWILIGTAYWLVALIILGSHILIDGWKSFRPRTLGYFLADQFFHFLVIAACFIVLFVPVPEIGKFWTGISRDLHLWKLVFAVILLTSPCGFLIGKMTERWRKDIVPHPDSLAHAGQWIGIIERMIVLVLVLQGQYDAIALLIAAKGIIRFNEKDRPEIKTEYLVIGTLLSIGIALAVGVAVVYS